MEYYDKYTKYKTKYLELKEFYGGFWGSKPAEKKPNLKNKSQNNLNLPNNEDIYIFYDTLNELPTSNTPLDVEAVELSGNPNFYYVANKDKGYALEHGNSELLVTPIVFLADDFKKIIESVKSDQKWGVAFKKIYDEFVKPIHLTVGYVTVEDASGMFKEASVDLNNKISKIREHMVTDLNNILNNFYKKQPPEMKKPKFKEARQIASLIHVKPSALKLVKDGHFRIGTYLTTIDLK